MIFEDQISRLAHSLAIDYVPALRRDEWDTPSTGKQRESAFPVCGYVTPHLELHIHMSPSSDDNDGGMDREAGNTEGSLVICRLMI